MTDQAAKNQYLSQPVTTDRYELERKRGELVQEFSDKLVALAQEDFRWQTEVRGIDMFSSDKSTAAREVLELIDVATGWLNISARDAFMQWFQNR